MASLEGARNPMRLSFGNAWDGIFDPLCKQVLIGGNGAIPFWGIKSENYSSQADQNRFHAWPCTPNMYPSNWFKIGANKASWNESHPWPIIISESWARLMHFWKKFWMWIP